jgi:hypothetical protein
MIMRVVYIIMKGEIRRGTERNGGGSNYTE